MRPALLEAVAPGAAQVGVGETVGVTQEVTMESVRLALEPGVAAGLDKSSPGVGVGVKSPEAPFSGVIVGVAWATDRDVGSDWAKTKGTPTVKTRNKTAGRMIFLVPIVQPSLPGEKTFEFTYSL